MNRKAYRQYIDTGVDWLGSIPAHWECRRIKESVESCRNGVWGDSPQGDGNDIPCIRVADFDRVRLRVAPEEPTIRSVSRSERAARTLRRGDLLLEKSGGGEKQPVGCVVLYDDEREAVCSNFIARMRLSKGMWPSFWRYVHEAAYAIRLTVRSINQTSGIQNLDQSRYFNEYAPYPPSDEQIAIAAFLERETAKIDALIDRQEDLIRSLRVKRDAQITHAVTRGRNPNAQLEESDVPWLGEVPRHWRLSRIKDEVSILGGGTPQKDRPDFWNGDIPWASAKDLKAEELSDTEDHITPAALRGSSTRLVPVGSVLVVVRGMILAHTFPVCLTTSEMAINQDLKGLYSKGRLTRSYLAWTLRGLAPEILSRVEEAGHGTKALRMEQWVSMLVPMPPTSEQEDIVAFIESESHRIDRLILRVEREIELLRARRTALVMSAVTGRIDVRTAVEHVA